MVDKVYLINLARDTQRLQKFSEVFGWEFERFEAIEGAKVTGSHWIAPVNYLSPSERGCLLSHITLWQELVNSTAQRYLIFEDDARPHTTNEELERCLVEHYTYMERYALKEPGILYLGKALDRCEYYQPVHHNVFRSLRPLCFHAYIISKEGAKQLLSLAPYSYGIDLAPPAAVKQGLLELMVFHPSLFYQDTLGTVSNLRSRSRALNLYNECLSTGIQVDENTWIVLALIGIALLSLAVLCYFYYR